MGNRNFFGLIEKSGPWSSSDSKPSIIASAVLPEALEALPVQVIAGPSLGEYLAVVIEEPFACSSCPSNAHDVLSSQQVTEQAST